MKSLLTDRRVNTRNITAIKADLHRTDFKMGHLLRRKRPLAISSRNITRGWSSLPAREENFNARVRKKRTNWAIIWISIEYLSRTVGKTLCSKIILMLNQKHLWKVPGEGGGGGGGGGGGHRQLGSCKHVPSYGLFYTAVYYLNYRREWSAMQRVFDISRIPT